MGKSYEVTGQVKVVEETKEYGSNGFTKRLCVIEVVDGQYSELLPLEAIKDGCKLLDAVQVGDTVTATVNLKGREYEGRYYPSIQMWKINVDSKAVSTPSGEAPAGEASSEVDDLAF